MVSVEIVPAEASDAPVLLQLIRELARYEKLEHEVTATADDLRRTLYDGRPAAEAVLARVDDETVGFALFFHNYSTFLARPGLYLEDLFVRPAWRGRGVGRRLLAHLADLALQRECGRLEWSVLDWNEPALRFYRSIGAEPMSEWTGQRLDGDALRELAGRDR